MKASTLSSLKKELATLPAGDVVELCLRLVKYKKENKELLSYLLFDAGDEKEFIRSVKAEIDLQFSEINMSHFYFVKKSIRKILKTTQKYIRYSGRKQTEVELLMHFCAKLQQSRIPFRTSNALLNLYQNQVRKIHSAIQALHEDLQHDYLNELAELHLPASTRF
jgi:membrane-anchored protein YejM (alkaline phosphatase superfamily)